jgi:hypothetical protein
MPGAVVANLKPTSVISLGAGVQSSTLLLLAAAEEFGQPPQLAIFADTGWEPRAVYEHLAWLEHEVHGVIEIARVAAGNLRDDALATARGERVRNRKGFASFPAHLATSGGPKGQLRRQCTSEYKVRPIRRELRRRGFGPRVPVEMWLGISLDEFTRMKPADVRYITNRWPLVELRMSREDCLTWWRRNYPGRVPPKSACIGCPYRSDAAWREVKNQPAEWADAVLVDEAIRSLPRIRSEAYLHPSLRPLGEVHLRDAAPDDAAAFDAECDGVCAL